MSKKFLIIFLIICTFLTFNSGFLATNKADAVSPIPVIVVGDTSRIAGQGDMTMFDRIAVLLWKSIVFPAIRDQVINFVATGDFKLSWSSIQDWLIHDLAFQTANAVLKEYIGFDLCTKISGNIIIALRQMYAPGYEGPTCTFDQSQLAQMTEKLFTGDSKQAWQDMKNYYYANFHLSLLGPSNQFGTWFQLRDNINTQINQRQQNIKFEMLINEGFLGGRDCTGVPVENQPEGCRVLTPGMIVAQLVKGSIRDPMDSALKAQMVEDMAALGGVVVDMIKNKFIYSMYNKL